MFTRYSKISTAAALCILFSVMPAIVANVSAFSVSSSVNLSNDRFNASYPNVQNVGNNVYVAWSEGSRGILFRHSTDGGATWSANVRLSPTGVGSSQFPLIAAAGADVYVVWSQGAKTIDVATSTNNGTSFSPAVIVSGAVPSSITPVIAAFGNDVYVVWDGNGSSYITFSTNNGATWSSPVQYASGPEPQVAAYGSSAYAVADTFSRQNSAVYFTNNNGTTWSRSGSISGAEPWISAYGPNVLVAAESKGNASVVRLITSTNSGRTFSAVRTLSTSVPNSWAPMTAIFGKTEYVAWRSNPGSSNSQEYVSVSLNSGATWSTPAAIGVSGRDNSWPVTVATTSSTAFIAWYERTGTSRTASWQALAVEGTNNGSAWTTPTVLGHSLAESDVATEAISTNGPTMFAVWTNTSSTGNNQVYFTTGA